MDCYLVDILYLSEAFWGARMGNCDIKPTDGANIFAYLMTRETSGIDWWIELRKKDEKWFEPRTAWWESRLLTTTPKGTVVQWTEFS